MEGILLDLFMYIGQLTLLIRSHMFLMQLHTFCLHLKANMQILMPYPIECPYDVILIYI
jgi:hypothetical protein